MDVVRNNEVLHKTARKAALLMASLAVVSACSSATEGTEVSPPTSAAVETEIDRIDQPISGETAISEVGYYPESAPPIDQAGNAWTEKEKANKAVNWSRRLGSIYLEDYPGNITQIKRGEIGVVDSSNPLAILEYTQLKRLYATCTGDSEKIYEIYLADKGEENGEMSSDLSIIRDRQADAGKEYYGDSINCAGWGWSFDPKTIDNIVWSEDRKNVSINIDQWGDEARDMITIRIEHSFVDGDWRISGKTILEPQEFITK